MRYEKPATTIDEQIAKLIARGMVVEDRALVERWLKTVGYFRLSAYWLPFEVPPATPDQTRSKRFQPGAAFEDVIDIYVFDRKLRLLVTEAIERIEIALRASWTNAFTLEHGAHGYLDAEYFRDVWDHAGMVADLAARVRHSSETFVVHYRDKYTTPYMPPLWVAAELMTFGQLSKWFKRTKNQTIRKAIARELGLPSAETLEGTVELLSYVRNICAHHHRLWNRRTVKWLPNVKRWRSDLVVKATGDEQSQAVNLIYNVLTAMARMLQHQSPETTFPERVVQLVKTRSTAHLVAMGFPTDWKTRPVWAPR